MTCPGGSFISSCVLTLSYDNPHLKISIATLMLAVLLFMPPVPRRAISPKQTPGPRVTKMMLSLGPPTTLAHVTPLNKTPSNVHLDRPRGDNEHLHANIALLADVVAGQEDDRLQLANNRLMNKMVGG